MEVHLERWRFALKWRRKKVSSRKTEFLCVNKSLKVEQWGHREQMWRKSRSMCGKDVKRRVQAGWNGRRKVFRMICGKRVSVRMKGKQDWGEQPCCFEGHVSQHWLRLSTFHVFNGALLKQDDSHENQLHLSWVENKTSETVCPED